MQSSWDLRSAELMGRKLDGAQHPSLQVKANRKRLDALFGAMDPQICVKSGSLRTSLRLKSRFFWAGGRSSMYLIAATSALVSSSSRTLRPLLYSRKYTVAGSGVVAMLPMGGREFTITEVPAMRAHAASAAVTGESYRARHFAATDPSAITSITSVAELQYIVRCTAHIAIL